MATPVSKSRELLFEEEMCRGSGVSESWAKKIAGISNFINLCQLEREDFKFNGSYRLGVGSCTVDGIIVFPVNVELVYIAGSNGKVGTTGISEWDIEWLDNPSSNQGSIFSTLPSFDTNTSDESYFLKDVLTNTDIKTATGIITPVVTKTKFLAGEAIQAKLVSAMSGAKDAQINFYYRPVN